MTLQGNVNDKETYSSICMGGIGFTFRLVNPTSTGTMTTLPNLRGITVEGILRRNGHDHQIFKNNLQDLLVESAFFKGTLSSVLNGTYMIQRGNGTAILTGKIDFHGVIDLNGGDEFLMTVTMQNVYTAANFTVNSCQLDVNPIEQEGHEVMIPMIWVDTITAGKSNYNPPLGDDVYSALFINYDQGLGTYGDFTDANTVVQALTVRTDDVSQTLTPDRMYSRMVNCFETKTEAQLRGQCYHIGHYKPNGLPGHHHHELMHAVKLDFTLNATLVTSGNNILVVRRYKHDSHTHMKAHTKAGNKQHKHNQKMHKHHGEMHMGKAHIAAHNFGANRAGAASSRGLRS